MMLNAVNGVIVLTLNNSTLESDPFKLKDQILFFLLSILTLPQPAFTKNNQISG